MTCPACGVPVPDGARFCPECGQRLVVAPDERRMVTVLMGDLVGFTALSAESDPEQVKRLVDDCFERLVADIAAFGGRLDKIVGDEIVAQFGAPVAHEDDAERAVRAALRMLDTLNAIAPELGVAVEMRIGVNTGEAVVGAMRAGGEPTVMGDVVNTAQRLEKLAAPGHVVVGPATYAATRDVIDYEALGPQGLRGREEPVDAYRALAPLTRPGRRRAHERSPLLGRDAELETLAHVVSMAASRRRAQLVLLSGDAGVGKSRLAAEVATIAVRDYEAHVLTGQCVPYGDANAYGPIAEALRHACGVDGDDGGGADVHGKIVESVARALALSSDATEVERVTAGLLYLSDGVTRPGVDPTRARDDALRSALAFLEALASSAPVVLTLSDVHWASDEALELCERMLARLHSLPFILVATTRPGLDERWRPDSGRHNALALHLDPLDPDATAELVRTLLCGEAGEQTVAFLLERSGGNPFFVEELVAFVHDTRSGELQRDLPATLHGLVAARLDTLGAAERSLLEDCAVVGDNGAVAAVVALAHRPDSRQLLEGLEERDFIQIDRDEFHFKSELIREIAYGTLTKAERARRHAALAPVLAERGDAFADQAAHHLATSAELVEEVGVVDGVPADVRTQAVVALRTAAERAEAVESWLQVEHHHDRTLGLIGSAPSPERRRALLGRARARIQQRALERGRDDAEIGLVEAREAGDRPSEALALTLLGEQEVAAGAYDVAEQTFGEALQIWRELDDQSGAANVLRGLGMAHMFRGDLIQADRFVSEALASYESSGNHRGSAWALQNLAWISFTHGDTAVAEKRLEESADLFGELGDWGGLGWAYGLLAFVRFNQGRLDEAAAIAEHIALEGQETGNRWAVGMMDVLLASVALWTGHSSDAVERAKDAIASFRDMGDPWGEVMATGSLIRALAELGRDDEYQEALSRFAAAARQLPDESMHDFPVLIEACVLLQRGEAEAANALVGGREAPVENLVAFADEISAVALTLLQLGDSAAAVAKLEPAYLVSETDGPRMALGCRLALAYAAAHRSEDALRVVEDLHDTAGGTYSDRIFLLWAESLAHAQTGGDARATIGAAQAIAAATDARVEHAIAALARAKVLAALDDRDAAEAADDATRQLRGLGITAEGWVRVFDEALAGVVAPDSVR
jgi:class 3 adenylate cyclase/tetratricopeptide (TPR) repeat protein